MKYCTFLPDDFKKIITEMDGVFLSKILLGGIASDRDDVSKSSDLVNVRFKCVFLSMIFHDNKQQYCINLAIEPYETTGYYTMQQYNIKFTDTPVSTSKNYNLNGNQILDEFSYQINIQSKICAAEIYRKISSNRVNHSELERIEQDHIIVFHLDNQKSIAIYPQNDLSGLINLKIVDLYDFMV